MTNPITPPPELVQLWVDLLPQGSTKVFTAAAQWGADQELEECCKWLQERISEGWNACHLEDLRVARRPKPPSLKEQALQDLDALLYIARKAGVFNPPENIRRALEQLDD